MHQIPKEVLLHEETHAKQKHSLDVVFIEIFQILFWFNPFIYLIKRSIKLNHEFLADQSVLNKGIKPSNINKFYWHSHQMHLEPQLANAINYSSIKKRFTVMKTQTSKQNLWIRSFILLPLLAILTFSFSNKQIVTNQQKATAKEITEYNQLAKKYNLMSESGDFVVKREEKERLNYLYNKMSLTQRKTAEPFPVFPPPPPAPIAPKVMQDDVIDLPPPPPPAPETISGEKVPSPLPPPPPKSPLEHVKEMAGKGAKFFYNEKPIGPKKAIELLKSNNSLNILTKHSDETDFVVHISSEPIEIKPE